MTNIDNYSYTSKLYKYSPKAKIVFGIFPLCISLCANSIFVSGASILIMGIMSLITSTITMKNYFKLMLIPLGFLILGTVTIVFERHELNEEVLFGFGLGEYIYGVDINSLNNGTKLILRALATVSCMYFISLSTPINQILYTLRKMGIPLIIVSLMELVYRYIFVIIDEANRIRTAQASRLGYCSFKKSIRSSGELIGMMFIRTYMKCDRIYSSLESRGYTGEINLIEREYENNRWLFGLGIVINMGLIAISLF